MKIKEKINNFKNKGEIKEIKEIKEFPGSLTYAGYYSLYKCRDKIC